MISAEFFSRFAKRGQIYRQKMRHPWLGKFDTGSLQ